MGNEAIACESEGMLSVALLVASYERRLLSEQKLEIKDAQTLAWYKSALTKLVDAAGAMPASRLQLDDLVSVKFSNHFVRVLKSLYKWAADPDNGPLIPRNQFRALAIPKCGQRTRTLSDDEVQRLIKVCSPAFGLILRVGLLTGARPQEYRAWQWGQVHLGHRVVILTAFKGKKRRGDGRAVRTIPLATEVVEILTKIRPENPHPEELVFKNNRGQRWTPNALRCGMRVARKKAGLDGGGERIVCYTARHTFGTNATRNGITDRKLADIMGHTTTAMTQRYQHLTVADLVDVVDQAVQRRM